jgi:di/tricarboxylate transporter
MKIETFLKILLACVLIFMIYEVIDTSLESSLFKEWDYLASIPWMEATLFDFYANVLCIYLWILYKEKKAVKKIAWLILLVGLGSIATCLYILKELFTLKEGESLKEVLIKQHA